MCVFSDLNKESKTHCACFFCYLSMKFPTFSFFPYLCCQLKKRPLPVAQPIESHINPEVVFATPVDSTSHSSNQATYVLTTGTRRQVLLVAGDENCRFEFIHANIVITS